ncbi:hypothetical protein JKG47_02010 [Acidithiobacillus sp. MC6.1]|nr:hypothetical protein [Acidithiobacillus sp. MC6.1]
MRWRCPPMGWLAHHALPSSGLPAGEATMAKDVMSDISQRMTVLSPEETRTDQIIKKIDCNQQRCFLVQMSQRTYDRLCRHLGNSHKADCWLSSRIEEVDTLPDHTVEAYLRIMMRYLSGPTGP